MKNIFSKFLVAFISVGMLVSCSEEFLNEPQPTQGVPSGVVFSSREGVEAFISGIMRNFRGQFLNTSGVATTDAAGLNSIFTTRSVKGNDIINTTSWYAFDYANDNREPTYRRTTFTWNYCFYMINQANGLIEGVEASTLADSDKTELAAYGYALRGFFYHQLVLEFAPTYSFDQNYPAPPIYTATGIEGKPMSTVKEVYALIESDLTKAVSGLTDSRLGKSYINKSVANAILAEVYQVMGKWPEAEIAANAAYGGNPTAVLSASTYRSGFNDYSNVEWIWGNAQSADQTNYYYGFPAAGADHTVSSYASIYINSEFVKLFSATDVRSYFFPKSASYPLTDYRYWTTRKFKFSFDGDFAIIRTPEMILLEAEAKARQAGKETAAHDLLYTLQKNRDVNAVRSTNTGNDLIEEILLERRKELYCENGIEWFDAKRLRRGITRTGNHRIGAAGSLTADDKKFFLKIPQAEIDANPFIEQSVNDGR